MSPSHFDDGWLLDLLAVEIRFNDPRALSVRETIEQPRPVEVGSVLHAVAEPAVLPAAELRR